VAYFVARVVDIHPAGDHTLYIGEVAHFEMRDGRPLLFHAGKYRRLPSDKLYSRQSFERVPVVMFLFLRDRFLQASEPKY
jgi:flavin reductase (DIM6/NTAB) family NADH-FMN oxidoreductase RutF